MKRKPLHKITSRSSSITNSFVQAIIPSLSYSDEEMEKALTILGMTRDNLCCVYCGEIATDWDHLHPMVENKRPTGFIDELRNRVPSCGPCNHSKSGAKWNIWMQKASRPKSHPGFDDRFQRLESYVSWGNIQMRELEDLVPPDIWKEHWKNHDVIQEKMKVAQLHALKIKAVLQKSLTKT